MKEGEEDYMGDGRQGREWERWETKWEGESKLGKERAKG